MSYPKWKDKGKGKTERVEAAGEGEADTVLDEFFCFW